MERHCDAIRNDRAARRELAARREEAEQAFSAEWERLFRAEPGADKWWRLGQQFAIDGERQFAQLLSEMAASVYHASPHIRNELINRRQVSSAAAAGRRNLIEAMLNRAEEPNLGIQQFPPELSMYQCLLAATGLHGEMESGRWGFRAPVESGPGSLRPVWSYLEQRVFGPTPEPVPLTEIYQELMDPPYGLTEGVLPILLCAFLRVNDHETTLYREGTFLAEPGVADWEVLIRRPDLFAVAGCRIVGERRAIVERLARGFKTEAAAVPLVRALLRMVKSLPEHAWKTRRVPAPVLALRDRFNRAQSPERLLFHDLPVALGVSVPTTGELDAAHVEEFFTALNAALRAWSQAYPQMFDTARDTLLAACGLPSGLDGWGELRQRAMQLQGAVSDPTLAPFLKRLAEPRDTDASVDAVLALVANRPPRSWTDDDVERFSNRAAAMGALFQQVQESFVLRRKTPLTPAQQRESRELQEQLRSLLPQNASNAVLRAALLGLLTEIVPTDSQDTQS